MKSIVSIILCALLSSCVSQIETMAKGGGRDSYTYMYNQIGGQGTAQSSMGTTVAFDGQKSLADVVQGLVARGASIDMVKSHVSDNALSKYKEGQITQRQLAALKTKLALAQNAGEVKVALAEVGL